MADPFVAEIRIFPFNFAPKGWAFCDGQLLPLSQNTALFSLLGTTYGGDGKSNFALPDLQGSAPMHPGQGPGLSLYDLGQTGGSQTVTLLQSEMPFHSHGMRAQTVDNADITNVVNTAAYAPSAGGTLYQNATDGTMLGFESMPIAGSSLPHNNMQPYLTLNFCIALQGVFPPRG
jgi:microcystin-dependent protein